MTDHEHEVIMCARCGAPAGAHQPWCYVAGLVSKALGLDAPGALEQAMAPLLSALSGTIAQAVAEAVAAALPAPTPAAVEPPPAPEAPPVFVEPPAPAEPAQRRLGRSPNKDAAADLFISEHVVADPTAPPLTVPQLLAAYEAWRPTIDAPPIGAGTMGQAMGRAGYTNRRQARRTDLAPDGQRYDARSKPMLYFSTALRAAPAEESAPEAAPEEVPTDGDGDHLADVSWLADRTRRPRERPTYAGKWPGREIPADFRLKIVVPMLQLGTGWSYEPTNANGKGKPRLISPRGRPITLPNTPSDFRAVQNTAATVKRIAREEAALAAHEKENAQ